MISIVPCYHTVKLCALAAQAFRSQQCKLSVRLGLGLQLGLGLGFAVAIDTPLDLEI